MIEITREEIEVDLLNLHSLIGDLVEDTELRQKGVHIEGGVTKRQVENFVINLLRRREEEIERLKKRQFTPEMEEIHGEYSKLLAWANHVGSMMMGNHKLAKLRERALSALHHAMLSTMDLDE